VVFTTGAVMAFGVEEPGKGTDEVTDAEQAGSVKRLTSTPDAASAARFV